MSNRNIRINKNKKRNLRKIQATDLNNFAAIEQVLNNLMDFHEWHSTRLDEWIDRVSQSEQLITTSPHFRSQVEQMFYLEITNVGLLLKRPWLLTRLIAKVEKINTRYAQKIGKPIIALHFVSTEEKAKAAVSDLEPVRGLESDSQNRDATDASEHIFLPVVE